MTCEGCERRRAWLAEHAREIAELVKRFGKELPFSEMYRLLNKATDEKRENHHV